MKLFVVYVKISYFPNVSKMPHEKVQAAKIKKKIHQQGMGRERKRFGRRMIQYSPLP